VHSLLSWNQIRVRKQQFTLSVLELLTTCVNTAWKAQLECIVFMLSLNLKRAFDNVSHKRLLHIMQNTDFSPWITYVIKCFLTERRTKIAFSEFESDWIFTKTEISQGSSLFSILFLFFISELLTTFECSDDETMTFDFVDDTNLITWERSAQTNCKWLKTAHSQCIAWAKRHEARFASDKYQLVYFTRCQQNFNEDLMSTVQFDSREVSTKTIIRTLRMQVDARLKWKKHVKQMVQKDNTAFEVLSHITASTWDSSIKHFWLLYIVMIQSAMLYSSQVWELQNSDEPSVTSLLKSLKSLQNWCLWKIMRAYKRISTVALKWKSNVQSMNLHIKHKTMQRTFNTADHSVSAEISETVNTIWTSLQRPADEAQKRCKQGATFTLKSSTAAEEVQKRTTKRTEEIRQLQRQLRQSQPASSQKTLIIWMNLKWKRRWTHKTVKQTVTTWNTDWKQSVHQLYDDLNKHKATALFLLCTEVLSLNVWLISVSVLNIDKQCTCEWSAQTIQHVLLFCSAYIDSQVIFFQRAEVADL